MTRAFLTGISAPSISANSIIKSGGTSSQFLKADGSIDSSSYLTTGTASSTYAPIASPSLTGTPLSTTAAADTNTTQIATTAYVIGQGYLKTATAASTYQPLDADLTSIAALSGTGLLKNTSGTWSIDTSTYLTSLTGAVLTAGGSTVTVASGTTVPLTIQNNGTGNSFVVNDVASDTTPFVIDAAGLVGIGMVPNTRNLSIFSDTTSTLQLANTASGTTATDGSLIYFSAGYMGIRSAETTGTIGFQTGGTTERMLIDSAGVLTTYNGIKGQISGVEVLAFGNDANGSIELGKTNNTSSTPFIDFHSGATTVDYDVRLLASGGTGTAGGGTLTIGAGTLALPAGTTVGGNTISGTWANYTPTWTNFTVGNGNVVSRYAQIGKVVFVNIIVTLGSTSSVTGIILASLPVTGANTSNIGNYSAGIYDATPFNIFMGTAFFNSTTQVGLKAQNSAGTYLVSAYTSATIPMTWTTSDAFQFNFNYEAA